MKEKFPWFWGVMLAALVAAGIWFSMTRREGPVSPAGGKSAPDGTGFLPGLSPEALAVVQGGHPLASELNAKAGTPQRDLEILREMLGGFATSLKVGNLPPMGDNEDVTAALTGHNRLKLVVIPRAHPSIDSKGRLLDRWGTPYFFHARGAELFDLRSAGPDRQLFTADDITLEPAARRQAFR